jgi:putative DNA primase/helicase
VFIVSGFPNVTTRVSFQHVFKDFKEYIDDFLGAFIETEVKEELPLFSFAEYAETGVRRLALNVLRVHALMLDVDKGAWDDFGPLIEKVTKNYGYAYYTTFSSSPEQLKFRLIVKLSRPVDISEWPRFWPRAIHYLGAQAVIDRQCSDACHCYYAPGGEREKYHALAEDGAGLDVGTVLDLDLPQGEVESLPNYKVVLDEADRGEITQGLRDYFEAKLQNLCDEIRARPYPGQMYDLKNGAVYGLARGAPHIIDPGRVLRMVRAASDARYNRHLEHPNVEADRQEAYETIEKALQEGMEVPWFPPKINDIETFPLTEYGLGERLLAQHSQDLFWIDTWERWGVWTGKFWNMESSRALVRSLMWDTVRTINSEVEAHLAERWIARETFEAAKADPDISVDAKALAEIRFQELDKRVKNIQKFANACETNAKTNAGIQLASCRDVLISYTELNRNKYLINFKNGTLDLATGQLRPHDRKDYITKMVPYDFNPTAKCPKFDEFLNECMLGKQRVVNYIWRLLGYTAIGVTDEQILILCAGDGSNGKSTFMRVMLEAFGTGDGGYAFAASSENLLTNKGANQHATWLMSMFGKRAVIALEVEEGRNFAESLIKSLTGSDEITGRKMRQDEWSYTPEFTPWVAVNQLPNVRGTDEGIWRRLKVIPWNASFLGKEKVGLAHELVKEIPGIWARIAREAVAWRRDRAKPPREVVAASLRYRRDQDPLQPFLDAWVKRGAKFFAPRDLTWAGYLEFAEASRTQTFQKKKTFFAALEKRFKPHKLRGVRGFQGFRLMTPQERQEATPRNKLLQAQKNGIDDGDPGKKGFNVN